MPVLLSVPHCVTHTRNGKPKPAELNTLALALILHKACGCHVIYNCDGSYDPNYDENDPYKCRVREYIRDNDIRFLIDLHGASRERTLDIEIGTSDGNNIGGDTDLVKLFVCIASLSFNHIVVDEHFKASGGNTVSSFVHHECGIPAIQAEINMRNRDEKDPLLFEKTASVFADYIKMLTLCGYSMRDYDCACVHVAKSTHPHNRVELPLAWKEYHTIGETCVITSVAGQKECRIKAFVQNSDSIAVGRRIFDDVFKRLPVALVARSESIRAKVYKPKVEAIDNTAISISDDLFELFGQNRYAEVFNPVSGIRAYLRV
ncbi:MAG: hypothetical protein K2M12_05840, partial [Muribaculaceae bacterium]|nr:hypothetical protein [Muribaculaceae bacterium]